MHCNILFFVHLNENPMDPVRDRNPASGPTDKMAGTIMSKPSTTIFASALTAVLLALAAPAAFAIDAEAAQALAKKNDCFKCHSVDKEKKGPSFKKIAAKYAGKTDGEEKVIKNMTTGPKVKLDDGTEEEHKIINTKDEAAIKNLAQWIINR